MKQEKKIERDLMKVVIFVIFLIGVFFIASYVFKLFSQVHVDGLTFNREKFGELIVYRHSYQFKTEEGIVNQYNLYLRYDPTKNSVPIEGDEILLDDKLVFLTIDTTYLDECADSFAAISTMSRFLIDNGFSVKAGNMDFTEAALRNQEYVTCENRPNNPTVEIFRGNETRIDVNGSCYSISIGPKCNVLEAVEKLETKTVADRRKRGSSS